MTTEQINALIAQNADLIRGMNAALARSPDTEFNRVEGYIGASKTFLPSAKAENKILTNVALDTNTQWIVNTGLLVQFWLFHLTGSTPGFGDSTNFTIGLKLEFTDREGIYRPENVFYKFGTARLVANNLAANALTQFMWDFKIPLRMRFCRITPGRVAGVDGVFTATSLTNLFTRYSPMLVSILGE